MSEKVTISKSEYESLLVDAAHLSVLEGLGVDNWCGYVGPYTHCNECDADEISWNHDKCPECGGDELDDADDYI